jgi:hypothetical protein
MSSLARALYTVRTRLHALLLQHQRARAQPRVTPTPAPAASAHAVQIHPHGMARAFSRVKLDSEQCTLDTGHRIADFRMLSGSTIAFKFCRAEKHIRDNRCATVTGHTSSARDVT